MTNKPEYERRIEERKLIKQETRTSILVGIGILFSCLVYGLIAYLLKTERMNPDSEETLYGIVNLFVILIFIAILAVRKSLYYSPRLISEDFSLTQVLQKWRKVDIVLLLISEIVPICGLILTILGMPFDMTSHLFIGTAVLIIILIPMHIKVRSKLDVLREHFPENSFS